MKNRMLEAHYIKKMSNDTMFLEETDEIFFWMSYRIMNAVYWVYQNDLSLLEEKLKTQNLEKKNEIKKYEKRIESIRNESEIRIGKIAKLRDDMKKTRVGNMIYGELIV